MYKLMSRKAKGKEYDSKVYTSREVIRNNFETVRGGIALYKENNGEGTNSFSQRSNLGDEIEEWNDQK